MTTYPINASEFDFRQNGDVFIGNDYIGRIDSDAAWCPDDGVEFDDNDIRHVLRIQMSDDRAKFFEGLNDYHYFVS